MPGNPTEDSSQTSQMLFQKYLTDRLGNYQKPAASGLKYQQEYILAQTIMTGQTWRTVANRLLLIREGINAACLMSDAGKRAQMHALALAIASGFLVPAAAGHHRSSTSSLLVLCGECSGCQGTVSRRQSSAGKECGKLAVITGKSSVSSRKS